MPPPSPRGRRPDATTYRDCERVRELTGELNRDTMDALQARWEEQLEAGSNLPLRGEQYAEVIQIGASRSSG